MDKETSAPQPSVEPTEPKPAPAEPESPPRPETGVPPEQSQPEQQTVSPEAAKNSQRPRQSSQTSPTLLPLALIVGGLLLMLAMGILFFMQ
ncbi:MAG: hypothetical protein WBP26_06120 [Candidatus Saccharimonadales bacterium]